MRMAFALLGARIQGIPGRIGARSGPLCAMGAPITRIES